MAVAPHVLDRLIRGGVDVLVDLGSRGDEAEVHDACELAEHVVVTRGGDGSEATTAGVRVSSNDPAAVLREFDGRKLLLRVDTDEFDTGHVLEVAWPRLGEGSTIQLAGPDAGGRGKLVDDSYVHEGDPADAVLAFCRERDLDFYTIQSGTYVHTPFEHLLKYRNRHEGERVFLVGNGPSLDETDLDRIEDEHAIAMNRISLLYDETDWRPSYYLYASDNVENPEWGADWQESVSRAVSEPATTAFIWDLYSDFLDQQPGLEFLSTVTERDIGAPGTFSTNAAQWVSKTGTSMNIAMQLAYFMGFDQFVFIGCDMNWSSTSGTEDDPNHFDDDYSAGIPDGERERRRMRRTHQHAARYVEDAGISAYNATPETLLDVYPLVEYDTIASAEWWDDGGRDQASWSVRWKRAKLLYYWNLGRYGPYVRNQTEAKAWSVARRVYHASPTLRRLYGYVM
jgi:hypothetical protein